MKQLSVNNILIIEDKPTDVQLIREYLKEASFKYRLFHSASLMGGIEIIEEKTIDLVLLDLSLDDTTGFNTLIDYLEKAEDVPVIVLTSNKNEAVGTRSVSAGAQDFLVKGEFNEQRLINAIKYSIQRFKSQAKLKEKNQMLAIKEKRYREAQKIGKYTNWEMNIVTNEMKWSDEMFEVFGFPHQSFSPTLSDYLRYVHIEDKENVDSFFENAIKTGELTKINHRILVQGRQVKTLSIRAQVKYDETTNTIILFGNLQDVSDSFSGPSTPEWKDNKPTSPEINLEYSSAIPRGFDFFDHLIKMTNLLSDIFNSNLTKEQRDILSKLAVSMGNYTKLTSNFHNLLPILEQNPNPKESKFNIEKLIEELKEPFIVQETLERTIVKIHLDENLSGNFLGAAYNIRLILFNLILSILQIKKNKEDLHVYVDKINLDNLWIEFKINFNGHLSVAEELGELASGDNIFTIENIKNLFQVHPVDVVTNAYMINALKGQLNYTTTKSGNSTLALRIPVKEIKKKVFDGKIISPVNILLAEDHVMNKIVLKKTLTTWSDKVKIKIVNSGTDILNEFKQDNYDLLVLNVELPDKNGMEVTKQIKNQYDIPVLGISSYPSNQEKKLCLQSGMNAYLPKPYTNEKLFDQILQLLG